MRRQPPSQDCMRSTGSIHNNMMVLEVADAKEGRLELNVRNAGMSQGTVADFEGMDRRLYQVLHAPREKRRTTLATLQQGSRRWKQMVRHFDPRTGADRSVQYSRVTHPVSQSGLTSARLKTVQSVRNSMQTWEQEVAEFEMKCVKKVDEDSKVLALESLMSETLFGGASYNANVDLRTAIINYLDDNVPVSTMKQGQSISTANMVQSLITGDQGEQGEDER